MGVIKRNSIYSTAITYFGLMIGAFNTLYFFPKIFTPEQFGLIKVILDFGNIWLGFAPLATIGLISKYNSYYKHDNRSSDFFTWILVANVAGAVLFLGLGFAFKYKVISFFMKNSPLINVYLPFIFAFCILFQIVVVLETFNAANHKLILPTVMREIVWRITQATLAILLFFEVISFHSTILIYIFLPLISIAALYYNLHVASHVRINFRVSNVTKSIYKEMAYFSSSLYAGNIFLMLANSLDSVLISGLKGLDYAAVFIFSNYIVTFISIPHRTISGISTPVISESWKHHDLENIHMIYRKSAVVLFVATYFMFLLIWLNLDSAYTILHIDPIYQTGKSIVLLLGITKLLDMGFGLNHEIMVNSKYWKQNFYFQVVLIILFIPINYYSIKRFGIIGPAVSNLILIALYNFARTWFIWKKFRLSPFSKQLLYCLIIGAVLYFLSSLIPHMLHSSSVTIAVRSAFFSILYLYLIYRLKISPDINDYMDKFINYLKLR
jgi:O-antigen/teichoic acid export membrane protein